MIELGDISTNTVVVIAGPTASRRCRPASPAAAHEPDRRRQMGPLPQAHTGRTARPERTPPASTVPQPMISRKVQISVSASTVVHKWRETTPCWPDSAMPADRAYFPESSTSRATSSPPTGVAFFSFRKSPPLFVGENRSRSAEICSGL